MLALYVPFAVAKTPTTKKPQEITITATCYNSDDMFTALLDKLKQTPIIIGKTDDNAESIMSLWAGKDGFWTLLATKDNITCVLGHGKDVEILVKEPKYI